MLISPVLAIVIPVFNEESVLSSSIEILQRKLNELISAGAIHDNSILLFVDDGSRDTSWSIIENACKQDNVKAIKLSRNFGHNNALLAGLMQVKDYSDVAITIDCDLQQDPSAIELFLLKYCEGSEIVFGIRNDRKSDGVIKKFTAIAFYRIMKSMGVIIHENHADYRLMSKKALEVLSEYNEPNIFLRAISVDMGLPHDFVYFDVVERKYGETKYSIFKMIKFAIDGIAAFSVFPLRVISIIGLMIFAFSVIMTIYVIYQTVYIGNTVPGWSSTVLPIYVIGGLQIFCIGVVGEYLGQVYAATKRRPRYIIEEKIF